jgi:hypothetical protein
MEILLRDFIAKWGGIFRNQKSGVRVYMKLVMIMRFQ